MSLDDIQETTKHNKKDPRVVWDVWIFDLRLVCGCLVPFQTLECNVCWYHVLSWNSAFSYIKHSSFFVHKPGGQLDH